MKQLERDLERIKKKILTLGALVEKNVYTAVKAVRDCDGKLADMVIRSDSAVDQLEVSIEEECLELLALHQPVASDLRFIIAVLKMNTDLERVGDIAVNIGWRATSLSKLPRLPRQFDFEPMADSAKLMLRKSLDALVNKNPDLAREVLASDDTIDVMNRDMHEAIQGYIKEQPEHVETCMMLASVSRNLERMADHATNIAEDVIYLVEGDIVRHGRGRERR